MNEDNNGMRYKSDIDINNKEDVHVVEFEYIDENKNVQNLDSAEMVSLLEECRDWRV